MLGRKYYWHTPPLDIIGGGNLSKPGTILNPEYIAALLDNIGLPCTPAGHTSGAQITTYHYNLISLKDHSKAPRAVRALSAALRTPCTLTTSDRAHIAVQAARAERDIVTLRQTVGALTADPPRLKGGRKVLNMRRYPDCQRTDGDCAVCSLSSYNRDCHNAPVNKVAYYRTTKGMTQQQLADAVGINIRQVQKFESGERDIGGAAARLVSAIAQALGVSVDDLLQ